MSFLALGIVTVIWLLYGYSLAFGTDTGLGLVGGLDYLGLRDTLDAVTGAEGDEIPLLAFAMFP
jgi:Amt family ammonium transporter